MERQTGGFPTTDPGNPSSIGRTDPAAGCSPCWSTSTSGASGYGSTWPGWASGSRAQWGAGNTHAAACRTANDTLTTLTSGSVIVSNILRVYRFGCIVGEISDE